MSATRVEETCSCGATFEATLDLTYETQRAVLTQWREQHRHESPPASPAAPTTTTTTPPAAAAQSAATTKPMGFIWRTT